MLLWNLWNDKKGTSRWLLEGKKVKLFLIINRKIMQKSTNVRLKTISTWEFFWYICCLIILLRQQKTVKVFSCVVVIIKYFARFNMNTRFVLCHYLSIKFVKQKSAKLSIDGTQTDEFKSIYKVLAFSTIKK